MVNDHVSKFIVAECRCGKIREIWYSDIHEETVDLYLKLAARTPCKACEMELNKLLNMCPETLKIQGGVSGCQLAYQHKGRCAPHPPPPRQVIELLKEAEHARKEKETINRPEQSR